MSRPSTYESLVFQDRQCLSDGCAADPKIPGKFALIELQLAGMIIDAQFGDHTQYSFIGESAQARFGTGRDRIG